MNQAWLDAINEASENNDWAKIQELHDNKKISDFSKYRISEIGISEEEWDSLPKSVKLAIITLHNDMLEAYGEYESLCSQIEEISLWRL
tara:strand:- start:452 stop:718 length:267 start_codon:yes stop_codon:yes gene_type:complete